MSRKTDTADRMGDSLRIDLTAGKARKEKVAAACEVFDANKTSAVLDACTYAARLHGHNAVIPGAGQLEALLAAAEEQGSLTAPEIAEILDVDELPVEAETSWSVGNQED